MTKEEIAAELHEWGEALSTGIIRKRFDALADEVMKLENPKCDASAASSKAPPVVARPR